MSAVFIYKTENSFLFVKLILNPLHPPSLGLKNDFILIKKIFALCTCTCEIKSFNRIKFTSFKHFEDNKLFILIKEKLENCSCRVIKNIKR